MKIGKVSDTVLKRSVLKQFKTKREEVILGSGVGEDCGAVKLEPGEIVVLSTDPITGTTKDIGSLAVQITVNDLASSGAEPVGILLSVLLPRDAFESDLKEVMSQVSSKCEELQIQVIGGHTEVTDAVNQPVITVTGVGKVMEGKMVLTSGAKAGQDIVLSKWIGLEGTSIIAKEKEKELLSKYPADFVNSAKAFDRYISVVKEAAAAVQSGVSAMHDVTEGGIYGALWELAEASGVGLTVDLKKIPIRQETIEICEAFDLNPYYLISSGSMLMTVDNGYDLVRRMEEMGIHGTVIGKTSKGNDRVVKNGEDFMYLERPKTDELYKIYETDSPQSENS